jgi:hypothetical protein
MLVTIPRHWFTWNCEVLENSTHIGSIEFAGWGEAGELITTGSFYKVYREGPLSPNFILEEHGNTIAIAEKPNPFVRLFLVNYAGIQYELKAESPFFRKFILQETGQTIGSIKPEHAFTSRAIVDLPTFIPLAVRLFMVWLVLLLWRRQQRQSSASNASASNARASAGGFMSIHSVGHFEFWVLMGFRSRMI